MNFCEVVQNLCHTKIPTKIAKRVEFKIYGSTKLLTQLRPPNNFPF
jgi:hypothetical protein